LPFKVDPIAAFDHFDGALGVERFIPFGDGGVADAKRQIESGEQQHDCSERTKVRAAKLAVPHGRATG
jgi:hypothetical protein